MKPCPCTSGDSYGNCCEPFHKGEAPPTALKLMRSRYAAYALCLPAYIIDTTHPQNPHFSHDKIKWLQEISTFSRTTEFRKLDILEVEEGEKTATVTFKAHLFQKKRDVSFTEKSSFDKVEGRWLYRSGHLFVPSR
ncbi:MAG: hypothetical protein JSR76_05285 [Verrucomicrobia bacterium]|nr:hypothetical protein [Verrucomicrobiota bacterium]